MTLNRNEALFAQCRECAADRLTRKPEVVPDIGTRHRQHQPRPCQITLSNVSQEKRKPLDGATSSKQQQALCDTLAIDNHPREELVPRGAICIR